MICITKKVLFQKISFVPLTKSCNDFFLHRQLFSFFCLIPILSHSWSLNNLNVLWISMDFLKFGLGNILRRDYSKILDSTDFSSILVNNIEKHEEERNEFRVWRILELQNTRSTCIFCLRVCLYVSIIFYNSRDKHSFCRAKSWIRNKYHDVICILVFASSFCLEFCKSHIFGNRKIPYFSPLLSIVKKNKRNLYSSQII